MADSREGHGAKRPSKFHKAPWPEAFIVSGSVIIEIVLEPPKISLGSNCYASGAPVLGLTDFLGWYSTKILVGGIVGGAWEAPRTIMSVGLGTL